MAKARKRQFPRLAVYAVSSAELRRILDRVESLSAAVLALTDLVEQYHQELDRLRAVPGRGRRRAAATAAAEGGDHEAS